MKRGRLLNAELSGVIATMGHGDRLAVVDAGMPIPDQARRIDLALTPNTPRWLEAVGVIIDELIVESYLIADELEGQNARLTTELATLLDGITSVSVPHSQLIEQLASCRAVVRTGEFTPYANTILVAGIEF